MNREGGAYVYREEEESEGSREGARRVLTMRKAKEDHG